MKKMLIPLLIFSFLAGAASNSVENRSTPKTALKHVWIFFTDKPIASSPMANLSARTLERRDRLGISSHTWLDRWPSNDYIDAIKALGLTIRHRSRWLNAVSVEGTETQLDQAGLFSFVKNEKPVLTSHLPLPETMPVLQLFQPSGRRILDYGYATEQIEQIKIDELHDLGFDGSGVRILVLDTGFNLTHPAFANLNVISQWDVINNDSVCANETDHENAIGQHNHGTEVLSTMAGYSPGELIGPAFGAEFLLAKTEIVDNEIQQEEDNYVAALEWGEARGADLASSSLGYLDWYTYCDMDGNTAVTTVAVDHAVSLGMICVTAMGNEGSHSPPANPCIDPLTYYMIAPADADSVISVGAVDNKGNAAYFTSHGPTYDGRIKPEVCARGLYVAAVNPNDSGYVYSSGTSLSTPLIGGATAVLFQAHPDWTPMEIRSALIHTASQTHEPDSTVGYGIANYLLAYNYTASIENPGIQNTQPESFAILSSFPNPFNGGCVIKLDLQKPVTGSLSIVDLKGRVVKSIQTGSFDAGQQTFPLKAGWGPSGVYFIVMQSKNKIQAHKLILLK